jgi:hypothetical protein
MEAQPSPAGSPGAITSTLGELKRDKARRTWSKASTTDALRLPVDGDFYKTDELVGPADQVRAFAEECHGSAMHCCVYPSCRTPG